MSDAPTTIKPTLLVQKAVAKAILTRMDRHDDYYLTKRDLMDAYRIESIYPVFVENKRGPQEDRLEYRLTFKAKEGETLKTLMEYVFKTLVDFAEAKTNQEAYDG